METKIDKLIQEAFLIEAEEAKGAGALGYMAKSLVQANLPHKKPLTNEYKKVNGNYSLTILAPSEIGLPYGTMPRLLLSWITTEAVRKQSKEITLGDNLSDFMRNLSLKVTGGRWGSITSLKTQSTKLFSSRFSLIYKDSESIAVSNLDIVKQAFTFWNHTSPEEKSLFQSALVLDQEFFEEIIKNPVPLDLRAVKALRSSSLALDIYCWLTYRMSYLRKKTLMPWPMLMAQFGSEYQQNNKGRYEFKRGFKNALQQVVVVYPQVKIEESTSGIILKPSQSHIQSRQKRAGELSTKEYKK